MKNSRPNNPGFKESMMSAFEMSVMEDCHQVDIDLSTIEINDRWEYRSPVTGTMFIIFIAGLARGVGDSVFVEENHKELTTTELHLSSIEYTDNLMDRFNRSIAPVDL